MAILIWVLVFLFGAYAALCAFYWLFQERFIFVRFRVARDYRFRFNEPFEEVFLPLRGGDELHALRLSLIHI